jgi:hypothetical protein
MLLTEKTKIFEIEAFLGAKQTMLPRFYKYLLYIQSGAKRKHVFEMGSKKNACFLNG